MVLPPFCISEKLTGIHVQLLNVIPTVYPFVLVIVTCILMELHARNCRIVGFLWKPFKLILSKANITEVTGDAVFHAFASLIFLSNTTVLMSSYTWHHLTKLQGVLQRKTLYHDPTVEWPSLKSVMGLTIALAISISVSVIPSVLLCIYPTRVYRYLSRFLSARKRLAITAFAEALHSCFKDGLNGTRDYRALAGASLFALLVYMAFEKLFEFIGFGIGIVTVLLIAAYVYIHISETLQLKNCK